MTARYADMAFDEFMAAIHSQQERQRRMRYVDQPMVANYTPHDGRFEGRQPCWRVRRRSIGTWQRGRRLVWRFASLANGN